MSSDATFGFMSGAGCGYVSATWALISYFTPAERQQGPLGGRMRPGEALAAGYFLLLALMAYRMVAEPNRPSPAVLMGTGTLGFLVGAAVAAATITPIASTEGTSSLNPPSRLIP